MFCNFLGTILSESCTIRAPLKIFLRWACISETNRRLLSHYLLHTLICRPGHVWMRLHITEHAACLAAATYLWVLHRVGLNANRADGLSAVHQLLLQSRAGCERCGLKVWCRRSTQTAQSQLPGLARIWAKVAKMSTNSGKQTESERGGISPRRLRGHFNTFLQFISLCLLQRPQVPSRLPLSTLFE